MKGSFKLFNVAGIGLFMHWSFFLLLGYFAFEDLKQGASISQTLVTQLFVLVVFSCVVLHELGHSLMARKFGIKTVDINVLPIGGIARLEKMPKIPRQELLIAIAGPLVNVAIAGILLLALWLFSDSGFTLWAEEGVIPNFYQGNLLFKLMVINVGLVVFNAIPAFPMDGGRVLRAALSSKMKYKKATAIASRLGQIIAVGFIILGAYYWRPVLLIVGVFIFYSATAEERYAKYQETVASSLKNIIKTSYRLFTTSNAVADVTEYQNLNQEEASFLVTNELGNVLGSIGAEQLAVGRSMPNPLMTSCEKIMVPLIHSLKLEMSLREAAFIMQLSSAGVLPVYYQETLIGVVYKNDLTPYFAR